MDEVNTSTLLPLIQPELPVSGALQPLVLQSLSQAAREFCRRTRVWYEDQTLDIAAAVTEYEFDTPTTGAVVIELQNVMLDGEDAIQGTDYTVNSGRTLILEEEPSDDVTGGLEARAVFAPALWATTLPDFLVSVWGEGIVAGALSELFLMPGKPWSDPDRANYWRRRFLDKVGEAIEETRGGQEVEA